MLFRSLSNIEEEIGSNQIRISFESSGDLVVDGELGDHFITWEWCTALMGVALGIDPFNQPNVTEAKNATAELLDEWNNKLPTLTMGNHEVKVEFEGASIADELRQLIAKSQGYIAILAYLDRRDDIALIELRKILAEKYGKPVTFGWGPRFQHSTGQFHKAGQPNGGFLIITGDSKKDYQIPGREFSFQTLVMAQALGEFRALSVRKYPVTRLHLNDQIGRAHV